MKRVSKCIYSVTMYRFIEKNILSCFLIYYLNFVQLFSANKQVIQFSQPSNCKYNEYFNVTSFSCTQCNTNKNLEPSADRLRCICGKHVDENLNRTFEYSTCYFSCPENTYPSLDRSKCFLCKDLDYNYYIDHMYTTNYHYIHIHDYCLYNDTSLNNQNPIVAYQVKFENKSIDSYYFRNELEIAIYFCKKNNELACEHLSNMCVLSLYANNVACTLFMQPQIAPTWLFYNNNETVTVLRSRQITQTYNLLRHNNDNILNFTVAVSSLHGMFKFIGTPNMPCNLLKNIRFGVNLKKRCILTVENLLNEKVEFMTPYLTFIENDTVLMHALPVLIKNINKNSDEISTWQLVRKFFFVDNISGFKTLSNFSINEVKRSNTISVLRYMKSLSVVINIQTSKDRNKIFPPLLIIQYAELTYEQISETTDIMLDYKVEFTLKDSTVDTNFKVMIEIFSGLAIVFSSIKAWNYSKRHHTSPFNVCIILWFFIYTVGTVGSVIIVSLITLCIYVFTFYKGQAVPYILLPGDINENTIKMFAIVAFSFKLTELLGFICQYWNTDVVFLDWEQPKALSNQLKYDFPNNSVNKLYANKFSKDKYKLLQTPSEIITAKRKKQVPQLNKQNNPACFDNSFMIYKSKTDVLTKYVRSNGSTQDVNKDIDFHRFSVSIWRTYFIVNQWLQLQTKRRISVIIQLVTTLCVFQIIQLYPWIFAISELTSESLDSNYNIILYYALYTLIYISIYCIQWLIFTIFYQPCVTNKMQEFVNLCSVANISLFILPFNHYGFYIHGRSVHGFADTDLSTLMNDLEKEKNNLCAHRGLVPGTTQQTFILCLTSNFRNIFKKISTSTKTNNFLKPNSDTSINWKQIFDNQCTLKQFLYRFIDHCLKEEDYIIKEQHFFEKLFNTVCPHNEEKSIFYIDNKYSFNEVLLYGNEWLLATFEISVFTFTILLFQNCILAITITISTSILIIILVQYNNKRNLDNMLPNKTFFM